MIAYFMKLRVTTPFEGLKIKNLAPERIILTEWNVFLFPFSNRTISKFYDLYISFNSFFSALVH